MASLLLRQGRIIDPAQGVDTVGDLFLAEGRIAWLGQGTPSGDYSIINAAGMVVCPGFIDLHCHLRQPGFEYKETIASGTRAAARGGFTTVCCMPNTQPPIDSQATVEFIRKTASLEGAVRVLPIGCITKGRKGEELAEMGELATAGVVGFSDDGSPLADPHLMRHALEYSLAFGLPVINHCEELSLTRGGVMNEGWVATRLGLRGMPAAAEEAMVARDLALAKLTRARLHIAHVSTRGSVELIRNAREEGVSVTAEVTPHHLTLTEEAVLAYNTDAKVNPPLRTEADIGALLQGLKEGVIDIIATDHAPHALVDKMCEFDLAAFGISGLETALGALLGLVHGGELDLTTLILRLTAAPAKILGNPSLGTFKPGSLADVAIIDPELKWVVNPESFASGGKNTPLSGATLRGRTVMTIVGGEMAYRDEAVKLESVPASGVTRGDN